MSVEHSDHEVIGGAQRSVQQLVFTAAQLVEVVARMRVAVDQRRETGARVAAAGDRGTADRLRARQDSDRRAEQAARVGARQQWAPVNDRQWRRDATPEDLLTGWAAATIWAGSDQHAAAAMLRARWPTIADRYDRLRVDDGLHPAAAMSIALTDAANAGWDPTSPPTSPPTSTPAATAPSPAPDRAALPIARVDVGLAGTGSVDVGLGDVGIAGDAIDQRAVVAAELALRWHPPVGATTTAAPATPASVTPAAVPTSPRGRTR